jgi:hypothetical protein
MCGRTLKYRIDYDTGIKYQQYNGYAYIAETMTVTANIIHTYIIWVLKAPRALNKEKNLKKIFG